MEGFVKEYANFLNDDKKPESEKFWELDKRMKEDKHHLGVVVEMRKLEIIGGILKNRYGSALKYQAVQLQPKFMARNRLVVKSDCDKFCFELICKISSCTRYDFPSFCLTIRVYQIH